MDSASISVLPASADVDQLAPQTFALANSTGTPVWSVDEADGGTVDQTGSYMAPSHAGVFHVKATLGTDTYRAEVRVRSVNVSFAPATRTVYFAEQAVVSATVTGTRDVRLSYSLVEQAGGQLVGMTYTAPTAAGVFHITATSQADPSATATLQVNVRHSPLYILSYQITGASGPVSIALGGEVVISSNGTGPFSSPVQEGTPYRVVLGAHQAADHCVLRDGYRLMPSADATVVVNCATPSIEDVDGVSRVLPRTDGKLIGLRAQPPLYNLTIVRFLASGQTDTSWTPIAVNVIGMQTDSDDSLVVLHSLSSTSVRLTRYNADGILDNSFGTGGSVDFDWFGLGAGTHLDRVALDAQHRIWISGWASNGIQTVGVIGRLTAGGQFDPTFGSNGHYSSTLYNGNGSSAILRILPSALGLYVFTGSPSGTAAIVRRVTENGMDDGTFSLTIPRSVTDAVATTSGNLVAWSTSSSASAVERYTATGGSDGTFNAPPVFDVPVDAANLIRTTGALYQDSTGHLLIAGRTWITSSSTIDLVRRLNPDGSSDLTYTGPRSLEMRSGGGPITNVLDWPPGGATIGLGTPQSIGAGTLGSVALVPAQ